MSRKRNSLFDQSLDRSVFVAYFLGAIVPLIGFAVLSERLAPTLEGRNEPIALAVLVVTTGLLSLGAFLALRRIVATTIARITDQNARLESLLHVARELAEAPHAQVVAESAACWALRLCDAEASWLLVRESWEKPFSACSERGERAGAWLEAHASEWTQLADRDERSGDDDATAPIRIDARGTDAPCAVLVPVVLEDPAHGYLVVARAGRPFGTDEVDAVATLAAQTGVAYTSADRGDRQRNFFSHMTDLVVAALDTHIQYRSGHASRVAEIANRVGRAMGLDDAAQKDLHFAALLHDVGMLKIPAANQRDPRFFRKHASVGAKLLSRIRIWQHVAPIVAQHHERPDGAGYPDGLVGEDIVIGARILAVCDAWDAMRTDDVHRPAMSVDDALDELHAHTGAQFDGGVVACLETLVRDGQL